MGTGRHAAGVRRAPLLVVPLAVLLSAGLVYRASTAAFTASTTNPSNSWQAGSVTISDDDSGNARFTSGGLVPGDTDTKCIAVSYGGNVASDVRLYASSSGTLAGYLTLTIEEGTGGSYADCTGFSGSSLFSGTLSAFSTAHAAFGTGVSSWAPSASESRTYRITYTVQDNNSAQGQSASATFTWESQSA